MTISDIIDFVNEERKRKPRSRILSRWTDHQIAKAVLCAIKKNVFAFSTNEKGKIDGFAFGIPRANTAVFDVQFILCSNPRELAHLLLYFKGQFKGWTLRGFRHGSRLQDYNDLDRFEKLVMLQVQKYSRL